MKMQIKGNEFIFMYSKKIVAIATINENSVDVRTHIGTYKEYPKDSKFTEVVDYIREVVK